MRPEEIEYRYFCSIVEDAWHKHNEMVDSWIDTGNYDALHASQEACEQLDARQHMMYKQVWCKHEHLQDSESTCPDCGKWFDNSIL